MLPPCCSHTFMRLYPGIGLRKLLKHTFWHTGHIMEAYLTSLEHSSEMKWDKKYANSCFYGY